MPSFTTRRGRACTTAAARRARPERFEQALYLLKKDIEQLMYARGTSPAKGSHLLANLKALLTHETSSTED